MRVTPKGVLHNSAPPPRGPTSRCLIGRMRGSLRAGENLTEKRRRREDAFLRGECWWRAPRDRVARGGGGAEVEQHIRLTSRVESTLVFPILLLKAQPFQAVGLSKFDSTCNPTGAFFQASWSFKIESSSSSSPSLVHTILPLQRGTLAVHTIAVDRYNAGNVSLIRVAEETKHMECVRAVGRWRCGATSTPA